MDWPRRKTPLGGERGSRACTERFLPWFDQSNDGGDRVEAGQLGGARLTKGFGPSRPHQLAGVKYGKELDMYMYSCCTVLCAIFTCVYCLNHDVHPRDL
jgi:hypothetical protein